MRGFELTHARRPERRSTRVAVEDPLDAQFPGRAHRAGVAAGQPIPRRYRAGGAPTPGFAEGYRVQRLIDAARARMATGRGSTSRREEERDERDGASWSPAARASSARRW